MPPSHPRPEDVAALVEALTTTGEHCADDAEELLVHMVTAGDHVTQSALEAMIDGGVDALRELSATSRELALALSTDVATADRSSADAPSVRQGR